MLKKKKGPFKRQASNKHKNFSIHAPWAGAALALIGITQLPTAIMSSIEIACLSKANYENVSIIKWCKNI